MSAVVVDFDAILNKDKDMNKDAKSKRRRRGTRGPYSVEDQGRAHLSQKLRAFQLIWIPRKITNWRQTYLYQTVKARRTERR